MNALVVVDVQNDFCPGGALPVKNGDQIVPVINRIRNKFGLIIATQDWHPKNHGSFASVNGVAPFTMGQLNGVQQVMWPDHCVEYSSGADFHESLEVYFDYIFHKGKDISVDSYSGFYDNNGKNPSGLADCLRKEDVDKVFVCGLATDYCVKFTAIDSMREGFKTCVIIDACRGVDMNVGDVDKALKEMESLGINLVTSENLNKGV